jgi:hypothetical protein
MTAWKRLRVFCIHSDIRLPKLSSKLLHRSDDAVARLQFDKDSAKEEDSEQNIDVYLAADRVTYAGGCCRNE